MQGRYINLFLWRTVPSIYDSLRKVSRDNVSLSISSCDSFVVFSAAEELWPTSSADEMKWNCNDFECVRKPTESRLSLTHCTNTSNRWAEQDIMTVVCSLKPCFQTATCHSIQNNQNTSAPPSFCSRLRHCSSVLVSIHTGECSMLKQSWQSRRDSHYYHRILHTRACTQRYIHCGSKKTAYFSTGSNSVNRPPVFGHLLRLRMTRLFATNCTYICLSAYIYKYMENSWSSSRMLHIYGEIYGEFIQCDIICRPKKIFSHMIAVVFSGKPSGALNRAGCSNKRGLIWTFLGWWWWWWRWWQNYTIITIWRYCLWLEAEEFNQCDINTQSHQNAVAECRKEMSRYKDCKYNTSIRPVVQPSS